MPSDKSGILARIALFDGLGAAEVEALARLAVERHYAAGATLFHEGEECAGVFIVGRGQVKIFKTSPSGREITIAVETAPSSVAELPMFDNGPYPASVTALEDVTALFIDKRDFFAVCRKYPDVALKVLAVVGRRLRHLVSTLESVTFGSIRQRLARLLLEMSEEGGQDVFGLPMTHQELASRLGTVREVVSRNLSRFQGEGLIRIEGRQVRLLNRNGLKHEAETEL